MQESIGDVVITLDIQSDPVSMIPLFVENVIVNNASMLGVDKGRTKKASLIYKSGKFFFNLLSRMLFDFKIPKHSTFFIGFNRQILNAINNMPERTRFLRIFASKTGFKNMTLTYNSKYRRRKLRTKNFLSSINYVFDALLTNSPNSLRFVSLLGLFGASLNFFYMCYVIFVAFFKNNIVEGWTTTSLQISFMFFLLFILLSFSIEYLIRNIINLKEGPSYFIDVDKQSNVMIKNKKDRINVIEESKNEKFK